MREGRRDRNDRKGQIKKEKENRWAVKEKKGRYSRGGREGEEQ